MSTPIYKLKQKRFAIKRAEEEDVGTVCSIIERCKEDLLAKGEHYWQDSYYPYEVLQMIKLYETKLVFEGDKPVATFTLRETAPRKSGAEWDDRKAVYVQAMAVVPEKQGQGIGHFLCDVIETLAAARGFDRVRLSTADVLNHFYLSQGYKICGKFDTETDYTLVYFEKMLGERK